MAGRIEHSGDDQASAPAVAGGWLTSGPGLVVLKVLTGVMGALIVAGVIVIGVTIAGRMSGPAEPPAMAGTAARAAAPFGDVSVAVPAGASLAGITAAGDRLVLRLRLADGRESLLVLDLATGHRLGSIALEPARP